MVVEMLKHDWATNEETTIKVKIKNESIFVVVFVDVLGLRCSRHSCVGITTVESIKIIAYCLLLIACLYFRPSFI